MKTNFFTKPVEEIHYQDYEKFKITYIIEKDFKILFLFVNDRIDDFLIIKRELIKGKEEFLNSFKDILHQSIDVSNFKKYDKMIDSIQNSMPPIISLVGYSGVGKTSIFNLLRTNDISLQHEPKISGDIATLRIGRVNFQLRDFTGQAEIGFLWNNFINGSDAILIITDSTFGNVERSRFFLNKIEEETPQAHIWVIANTKNIQSPLESSKIEEILGNKTTSINAINTKNRDKLIQTLINTLDMSEELSPLLISINERNKLINELERALIAVDFETANILYDKIINLILEIGDSLDNMEFYKNYQKIKSRLNQDRTSKELPTSKTDASDRQYAPQRISSLEKLLKTLLSNFMSNVKGILEVIISDREGFVITSESKKDAGDESVLGAIAVTVDSYIERIKREFGTESSFFNITIIQEKKFAYCSMGSKSILLTISDLLTTDTELRVYSEHVARKVELLLEGNEHVSLEIPTIIKTLSKTKDGKIPTGDYSLKLILTGDYKVGKTSLILRFVQNLFKDSYQSTIGVDISQKVMQLSESTMIRFIIWDIGGQIDRMAPYRKRFYGGANSALIIVDRTRSGSLKSVEKWYEDIRRYVDANINIIIVGNKSDLVNEIVVSEEDLKNVANQYGFSYLLTSAKTGENVNDVFQYIAYKFLEPR